MIIYSKKFLGLNILLRPSGSAIYKAAVPGLVSVLFVFLFRYVWKEHDPSDELDHPYGIGILVSSVSFVIIFRANYGYQRHWEACGAVHVLMSKWLDAASNTAMFHMQSKQYNKIKPPSYFDTFDLNALGLSRDRQSVEEINSHGNSDVTEKSRRNLLLSIESTVPNDSTPSKKNNKRFIGSSSHGVDRNPTHLMGPGRRDGGWGSLYDDGTSTYHKMNSDCDFWRSTPDPGSQNQKGFAALNGGRTHSLFLQELCHLSSLCLAVAFCTLRNDVEGAISPLGYYTPGMKWPEPDSAKTSAEILAVSNDTYPMVQRILSFFGHDRSPQQRTQYNAARPMLVLGGVSPNEIAYLQKARGPAAKVTLAFNWLSEFIVREHIAGSLGPVGPPIISRLFQFLSDGMIHYNHARKIMYLPFPFPHAQLCTFFIVIVVFAIPLLLNQYAHADWLAATLSFLSVTCLSGLHEVARELENPFRNIPNEVPLCTFLAMFNESLVTLYSGFHPDHYWDPDEYRPSKNKQVSFYSMNNHRTSKIIHRNTNNNNSTTLSPEPDNKIESAPTKPQSTDNSASVSMKELLELINTQRNEMAEQRAEIETLKKSMKEKDC